MGKVNTGTDTGVVIFPELPVKIPIHKHQRMMVVVVIWYIWIDTLLLVRTISFHNLN